MTICDNVDRTLKNVLLLHCRRFKKNKEFRQKKTVNLIDINRTIKVHCPCLLSQSNNVFDIGQMDFMFTITHVR